MVESSNIKYRMTQELIDDFISFEKNKGASANMVRRFLRAVRTVYDYLPQDKILTKDNLLEWRLNMETLGYSPVTILNYVKYINRYLDFSGCSDIRFNKGRFKDISGQRFGYLIAVEPVGQIKRGDIVWKCQCKCGNTIDLPATRLLLGNTQSCGCKYKEHLSRVNKYIDNTSLRQSLEERIESKRSRSGYTGVISKRNKWQAYINYKGKRYSLGCYSDIQDALKARARAKQLVQEDSIKLLSIYNKKNDFISEGK